MPEIDEVILSLNYQPRRIEEIFGDGEGLGVTIRYVVEPVPLGTGGAIRYAGDSLTESVVVFNGDVLTQVDLAAVLAPAPRAEGQGDDRPDAGRQSRAPTAWSRPTRRATSARFLEKPGAGRDHLQHDQRGHLRARARDLRPHPERHRLVDRAQLLPVADRARRDVRRVRPPRLLDRHRHAGEVPAGPPRHHGRALLGAAVCRATPHARVVVAGGPRSKRASRLQGPCFMDEGAVVKAGARILPYWVSAARRHVDEGRGHRRRLIWPERLDRRARRPCAAAHPRDATAISAATSTTRRRGSAGRQDRHHGLQQASDAAITNMHPASSRRTTSAASIPSEINEDAARLIGRGFVSYLEREADRRLARHAAVVAVGGGGVHRRRPRAGRRRRRLRDDGHRHDVLRRRARRPRRRRADHRVAQPEGVQRHQAGAAGGVPAQRRGGHQRHPRHDRRRHAAAPKRPPPAASRRRTCSTTTSAT